MPLCVCSAAIVPWGSASFILLNLCLFPFLGYYECLKLVLPPVSNSYSFSETLKQRMWATISVSVWENTASGFSSTVFINQCICQSIPVPVLPHQRDILRKVWCKSTETRQGNGILEYIQKQCNIFTRFWKFL